MMTAYFIGGPSDCTKQVFRHGNPEYMPVVMINGCAPLSPNPRGPRVLPEQHRYQKRGSLANGTIWIYEYTGTIPLELSGPEREIPGSFLLLDAPESP
jgi:hypothetical protein